MEWCRAKVLWMLAALFVQALPGQVIEFESGGLKYQTLTRNGVTIMFAQLPSLIRDYSVLQVAVSNGGSVNQPVKPDDFVIRNLDGTTVVPVPARQVVRELVDKANRGDVIRLVTQYEQGLYGNVQYKSTNGFEQRRRNAFAEVSSVKLKAAAAASAIAFVQTRLPPGQSTDGAVFYANAGRPLGPGTLTVRAAGAVFEFPIKPVQPDSASR